MHKQTENCTITCKGVRTLFVIVAALLGLNILLVAAYGIASIFIPLNTDSTTVTEAGGLGELDEKEENEVVAEIEIEQEVYLDFTQGEVLVEPSSPLAYTALQSADLEVCDLLVDVMNIEDVYLVNYELAQSDAFYSTIGKLLPGGDLDFFFTRLEREMEETDQLGYVCSRDNRLFFTLLTSHANMKVLEWLEVNEETGSYALQSYESIDSVMDSSHIAYLSPYSEGVLIKTGYGDAGYIWWSYYDYNPAVIYPDLLEKCTAHFEYATDGLSEELFVACRRQYKQE
jgi:hypothetical protein